MNHLVQLTWVGAKGAETFVKAALTGDIATNEAMAERRGQNGCKGCLRRVNDYAPGGIFKNDWCGKPLDPVYDDTGKMVTCGCLCMAKTFVASQECPQGRWKASERAHGGLIRMVISAIREILAKRGSGEA